MQSLVGRRFANKEFSDEPFYVPIVLPKRTFLEKAFLLHEEFQKPIGQIRVNRLSRHLYDLDRLSGTEHCEKALKDTDLYQAILAHREKFNPIRGIDYANHLPNKINFIPPEEVINNWEADYKDMQENMIYGDSKSFKDLIASITELNEKFRNIRL